jgi:hypothetical protein
MNYAEMLKDFDEVFAGAKVRDGSLADGKYEVTIDRVSVEEKDLRINLVLEFVVINGDNTGARIFKRSQLNDKKRVEWLKTDLHKMGLKIEKISEIESCMGELLDRKIEVNLKAGKPNANGKTYQNCYIVKEISPADSMGTVEDMVW